MSITSFFTSSNAGKSNRALLLQCFVDTFLTGLAAHAAFFFGNLSFHDDVVCTYDVGATHIFGRFTLGLLGKLTRLPFGGSNYSLPWFNGLLSLIFLALSGFLMIRFLELSSRFLSFLLCGILAVFPVLTATFAYGFTAPYYMLAFFLAVFAAVLLTRGRSVTSFAAGILLGGLMIGIYQAYLPVMLSMEVLLLLQKELTSSPAVAVGGPVSGTCGEKNSSVSVLSAPAFGKPAFADFTSVREKKEKDNTVPKNWLSLWGRSLLGTVLSFVFYLLMMKLSLSMTGKELYAYRGLDTLGEGGNFSYPVRILMAYRMFFNPDSFQRYRGSDDYLLFMWSMRPVYRLLIVLIFLLALALLGIAVLFRKQKFESPADADLSSRSISADVQRTRDERMADAPAAAFGKTASADFASARYKKEKSSGFLLRSLVLLFLFPLCANFIFVMTDFDVYSLMLYGEVMIFVLALFLADRCLADSYCFMSCGAAHSISKDAMGEGSQDRADSSISLNGMRQPKRGIYASCCRLLCLAAAGLVAFSLLFYLRYDNLCYYKLGRMQEEAIAYDTALVTRIQQTDGYDPSLPVCFVHGLEKDTSFLAADPELARVTLTPYGGTEIINDYSWVSFLRIHCGYAPTVIEDGGQYDDYLRKNQVPRYPAADSIRILDGTIVVNF